jgi:CRP-like cAMP-binding protein
LVETLEPLLAEQPIFRDLAPGDLQLLTGCAKNVRFEAGQVIFREGADADQFYLIREGRVALEVFTPRGPAPIQTISAGDALGWSWLIPPYKWRFDARAIETTRAFALDGKCLRGKCDGDPRLGSEGDAEHGFFERVVRRPGRWRVGPGTNLPHLQRMGPGLPPGE